MALQSPVSPPRPYTVEEAAELLGLSPSHIRKHYAEFGGLKTGDRYLIPRHAIDALVYGPDGPKPALRRALELLPALSRDERIEVARAALSEGGAAA